MAQNIKILNYSPQYADLFFIVLERHFAEHDIDDEINRFKTAVDAIPLKCLNEASTKLVKEMPKNAPYSALKKAILDDFLPENYRDLLGELAKKELGDLKPSEFLAELLDIADPFKLKTHIIMGDVKMIWLRALPEDWMPCLLYERDLEEAARKADSYHLIKLEALNHLKKLCAAHEKQQMDKVDQKFGATCKPNKNKSKNRKTRMVLPDLCFYHDKYGQNAERCDPKCRHFNDFEDEPLSSGSDSSAPHYGLVSTNFKPVHRGPTNALFDPISKFTFRVVTGSAKSMLPHKFFPHKEPDTNSVSSSATYGTETLTMSLGMDRIMTWNFVVADVVEPIIGCDFLSHYHFIVNCSNSNGKIELLDGNRFY